VKLLNDQIYQPLFILIDQNFRGYSDARKFVRAASIPRLSFDSLDDMVRVRPPPINPKT